MKKKIFEIIIWILLIPAVYLGGSIFYWFIIRGAMEPDRAIRIGTELRELSSQELAKKLYTIDPISPYPGKAIYILGERKYEKVVPDLIKITYSINPDKRKLAISALGKIGDKKAIPRLVEMYNNPKTSERDKKYITKSLGRLQFDVSKLQ